MRVKIKKKMICLIPYNTYLTSVGFNSRSVAKYISTPSHVENVLREPFTRELVDLRFHS